MVESNVDESARIVLAGMDLGQVRALVEDVGEPAYRGAQVFDWIHRKLVQDPREMTNLPSSLRDRLSDSSVISTVTIVDVVQGRDETQKFLFSLDGDDLVEGVVMRQQYGRTLCLSTQVGCRWRCAFCASGAGGLERNLLTHELVGQVLETSRYLWRRGEKLQNLVLMGMGEPLDNPAVTVRFLKIMSDPAGMGMSPRRFTVSTVGIVPGIDYLARERMPLTLAVSLHAPNDQLRNELVPANRRYPVADVVESCRRYFRGTGRRITFEYVMIEGVNDLPELARELCALTGNMPSHVNLIPLNPAAGSAWRASSPNRIRRFADILGRRGSISVTIRRSQGLGVSGACGQLRRVHEARRGGRKP